MRRWYYQTVLREASRPEDLTAYLDGATLASLWPELYLPKGVRRAWEERHPSLRAAGQRLMPLTELHRRVATVALRAANRYGFALGGGNALIAHGLIDRPTQDVDLFTEREGRRRGGGPLGGERAAASRVRGRARGRDGGTGGHP